MESLKKNRILIVLFSLSLIAFLIYQFGGFVTPTIENVTVGGDDQATKDILRSLNQMQQARIDTELLSSTVWTNLVDYSVSLPTDIPGRPDLFGNTFQTNTLPLPGTVSGQ